MMIKMKRLEISQHARLTAEASSCTVAREMNKNARRPTLAFSDAGGMVLRAGFFAALLLLMTSGLLLAESAVIGDPSFEGNSLSAGGWANNLGPEWEEISGPSDGNGFEEYILGFSSTGSDHLGMQQGHRVWQDLGIVYQANTRYTLTVAVGNRGGSTQAGNLSTYGLANHQGDEYLSAAFDASTLAGSTFADAPVLVFDTASNPLAVGKSIRILLRADGSGRSHFDNIRLDVLEFEQPGTATIVIGSASELTAVTATLNAEVTDIGDDEPQVTFFYGTENGGLDPGAWEGSLSMLGTHSGGVSVTISGLQAASNYHFSARATNSVGDAWSLPGGEFETLALPAVVSNLPATDIGGATATLGAMVSDSGGDNPQVEIYYGPSNGGEDPAAWAHSVSLGTMSDQASVQVDGLISGTQHYFRARATNSAGTTWAPASASFTTEVVALARVSNRSPSGITGTTASLRGEVDSTGGESPVVTLFYGPTAGGTNPGAWESSVSVGQQDGGFSAFVRDLDETTTYWYRCRAVNSAGTVWSADSIFFSTTALIPSGVVINEIHYDPSDEATPGEFIELHNPGDSEIDLSSWSVTDAVTYTFPSGTIIQAGAYLVVAQDPATILARHGVTSYGPWQGRLKNSGEQIDLRDSNGSIHDQVAYGAGFPWPTGARGAGGSAQLIHPSLDRDLGGSWRDATGVNPEASTILVAAADPEWRYRKGRSEASSPANLWRDVSFVEDGSWNSGQTPIGYGDGDDNTVIDDMEDDYSSVYLRRSFTLQPDKIPTFLRMRVYVDDGAVIWINGEEVARLHVPSGQLDYDDFALNHEAGWETVTIANPNLFLVGGTNVIAVHALNSSISSSDFSLDLELTDPGSSAGSQATTPGARNSTYSEQTPPQIRQVTHMPEIPSTGLPVTITAKITDPEGVGAVHLEYQVVEPGAYIAKDDPAYLTGWTSVTMVDDGSGHDSIAGDFEFTAAIPIAVQQHRRMVRYRILFEDALGEAGQAPWPDDEQPNFAYYVYDGVPDWSGSFTPGGTVTDFDANTLNGIQTYHLLANETDVTNCQYTRSFDGVHMPGALVYNGKVYDHIEFENRGEASTYVSGKNKWRFHFNRARSFQARDNHGKPYGSQWRKMNFDACASPWAAVHRGMAGVEEAVSYRLYELCGVPSPRTHFVHFRVVDDALETDPASQYEGDLWGLYLVVEQPSGSFLGDRDLPDGNVYKIQGGSGNKKEQGLGQASDSSDWNAFYSDTASSQTESWWRDNLDMANYYSFRACNRISGNVDLRQGYNHYYYHHPAGHWVCMPWDLDMMFIPETHWPGHIRAQNSLQHPAIDIEFRNRSRELLDLMCSDASPNGGQIGQLINEYAEIVNPYGEPNTWADIDAAMWNYHPRTRGNPSSHGGQTTHKGNFYYSPFQDSRAGGSWTRTLTSSDHEGSMAYLLDYATDTYSGSNWEVGNGNQFGYGYEFLQQEANDANIPIKPGIAYIGAPDHPLNDLRFSSGAFSDPQGSATFAAMRWRLAEVAAPGKLGFIEGDRRKYEVETLWDSGEIDRFSAEVRIPVIAVRPDRSYRVRVRHKDTSGRWSHWSDAVEFVATAADVSIWQENLVISEFMYNPTDPTGLEEETVSDSGSDFEFIELRNVSPTLTIDLTELRFTKGINFDFVGRAITELAPGEYVVIVKKLAAFEARYGSGVPVIGEFDSGGLSNGGEEIKLSFGAGIEIHRFTYGDSSPWPPDADGDGPSLVLIDPASVPDHTLPENWMSSAAGEGTPGAAEPAILGTEDAWKRTHFTELQQLDPAISGPDADPDHDRLSNLEERAFASSPWTMDAPALEFVWIDDAGVSRSGIRFRRPEGSIDLSYVLEAGNSLNTWEVVSDMPQLESSLGDGTEQMIFADILDDELPQRFLRIRVIMTP